MQENGRVKGIGEADYTAGSLTAMWLTNAVEQIASRIADDRDRLVRERTGTVPTHILSDIGSKSQLAVVPVTASPMQPTDAETVLTPPTEWHVEAGRQRFYAACKLYLRTDFEKNKSHFVQWFDDRAGKLDEAEFTGLMDEFERSANGSVGAQHQRRSSKPDNSASEKLLQFLDNLAAKHRRAR